MHKEKPAYRLEAFLKGMQIMIGKRAVPQAVFDSPEALRVAKRAHEMACRELNDTPRHLLDEGNPNHPRYDLHIFGEHHEAFLKRQYVRSVEAKGKK